MFGFAREHDRRFDLIARSFGRGGVGDLVGDDAQGADDRVTGRSVRTWTASPTAGASARQWAVPSVFGTISEPTRISRVRTAEDRPSHCSPKTTAAWCPTPAAPTVWAMVLSVRMADSGSSGVSRKRRRRRAAFGWLEFERLDVRAVHTQQHCLCDRAKEGDEQRDAEIDSSRIIAAELGSGSPGTIGRHPEKSLHAFHYMLFLHVTQSVQPFSL